MKSISSTHIIAEAIKKLEQLKKETSSCAAVEQIHAVRAYCDLLLTTYTKGQRERTDSSKQSVPKERPSPGPGPGPGEASDSLLDF